EEQLWVQRWQNMHSQPQQELSKLSYPPNTPRARAIWQHGIDRLSRTDVEQTIDAWLKLAQRDELIESDHNYARRQIGLHAAWQHNPVAAQWLDQLPPEASDPLVRQWRLLSTLRSQDWVAAERAIATLSPEELDENKWLYWKARILSKNGDPEAAREIFQELAKSRHYYGFLAADQIDYPYYMGHTALNASADDVHRLENRLSMITARELYHIGEMDTARSQWDWATRNLNEIELRAAAAIAYRWQWHDRAIITVTRAGHRDDLELRFPLLYQELIQTNANVRNLDVASIFGVIRQESAFVVDARSGAGALGLMQLMPQTARLEGRKHELELSSDRELFDPRKNITLGTGYLRTLLDRFGGNLVLATASYNAGPNRVQQWLPQGGTIDADVWVETIPFSETRNFVKNVLAFSAVYDYRLGKKPKRLRERMPPIHSAG
ncbi:MAG: lytic transglycosylase domain-containing protein, partial [Gammaproteobacteria bacterium]|nr:lytic transglycosylase domain-containing protein [Gammaproteobacteria bacterium]